MCALIKHGQTIKSQMHESVVHVFQSRIKHTIRTRRWCSCGFFSLPVLIKSTHGCVFFIPSLGTGAWGLLTGPSLSSAEGWESLDGGLCAGGQRCRAMVLRRDETHQTCTKHKEGRNESAGFEVTDLSSLLCAAFQPPPQLSILPLALCWSLMSCEGACTFVHLITSESSAGFHQK